MGLGPTRGLVCVFSVAWGWCALAAVYDTTAPSAVGILPLLRLRWSVLERKEEGARCSTVLAFCVFLGDYIKAVPFRREEGSFTKRGTSALLLRPICSLDPLRPRPDRSLREKNSISRLFSAHPAATARNSRSYETTAGQLHLEYFEGAGATHLFGRISARR